MRKVCVTGHRVKKLNEIMKHGDFDDSKYLDYIDAIFVCITNELQYGDCCFITGGALGVDLDFAKAVIQFKQNYNIFSPLAKGMAYLEVAVPCKNQEKLWNTSEKKRYKEILKNADYVTYIGEEYTNFCMQQRNEYMVNCADKVLVFWNNQKKGGTYNTLRYAKSKNKNIEVVDLTKL